MFILSQFSYGNECLCVLLSFPRNTFHRLKCFCAMKTVIISSFFALIFGFVYVARPIFVFSSLTFEDIMQSKSKVWMDLMHLNSDMNFSQCCSWKRTDNNSPMRWQKFGWQKFAFTLIKLTYFENVHKYCPIQNLPRQ